MKVLLNTTFSMFMFLSVNAMAGPCHSGDGMDGSWADSYTDDKGNCYCGGGHDKDHGSEKFWDEWCSTDKLKEISEKNSLVPNRKFNRVACNFGPANDAGDEDDCFKKGVLAKNTKNNNDKEEIKEDNDAPKDIIAECNAISGRYLEYCHDSPEHFPKLLNDKWECVRVFAVDKAVPSDIQIDNLCPEKSPNTGNMNKCANQGGKCQFSGSQKIVYGADGFYKDQKVTDGIDCTNDAFGEDPAEGVNKACYIELGQNENEVIISTTSSVDHMKKCSNERVRCEFSGEKTVFYGAEGSYLEKKAKNGIECDNATFGKDPAPGAHKACYIENK